MTTLPTAGRRLSGAPRAILKQGNIVRPKWVSPLHRAQTGAAHANSSVRSALPAQQLGRSPCGLEASQDLDLLRRVQAGDRAALDELASKYRGRLYGIAYRFLKDHQDAEEIAQDSLIRAFRGLQSFRGDSAFSTWLYSIGLNLARNRYWHSWRRKRHATVSIDSPVRPECETTWGEMLPNDSDSPAIAAEAQDMQESIDAGMKQLAQPYREILELRNIAHTSYQDIADALSISIGTVKSRIARARESLRRLSNNQSV